MLRGCVFRAQTSAMVDAGPRAAIERRAAAGDTARREGPQHPLLLEPLGQVGVACHMGPSRQRDTARHEMLRGLPVLAPCDGAPDRHDEPERGHVVLRIQGV